MIFTVWGEDGHDYKLIFGGGPPRFDDGTPMMPKKDGNLVWTIEAESWEEACRKYHELQGWAPYEPMETSR